MSILYQRLTFVLMRTFIHLLILLLPLLASAQEAYFRQLAGELCECLEQSSAAPEQAAMPCLEQIALRNEGELSMRFELDVSRRGHRRLLAERLVPDLLDGCPLLSTLQLGVETDEKRWSDGGTRRDNKPSLAFTSPKGAPPPTNFAPGEPPLIWRVAGELVTQARGGKLRLLTTDGQEKFFELPKGFRRKSDFRAGERVSVFYRREWRVQQKRIVLVVVNISANN